MSKPHIVAIPYPAQGHVIPIMELSQSLVEQGFKVTIVNSEYNHNRVINALGAEKETEYDGSEIRLVYVPDGMKPGEDRNDVVKLTEIISRFMPGNIEELIKRMNESEDEKITCVIGDMSMGWTLELAEKMKIPRVGFWPLSAISLSSQFSVPKLLEDGIIDSEGIPITNQMVQLAPEMPAMHTQQFVWCCHGDVAATKICFDIMMQNIKAAPLAKWILCNSVRELEPGAFSYAPKILPIGPLLSGNRVERRGGRGGQRGHFWKEDTSCLNWLDQQQPHSVTYVAFGSYTVFDKDQFQELALALELSGRPFLWTVRIDSVTNEASDAFPNGFQERVISTQRGLIVGWAPQQKVLSHPSIACFISHCGWNSVMDGISSSVPFLCWPYFSDQFLGENYVCDTWKIGLRLNKDPTGIITKEEIKSKLDLLCCEKEFKDNALEIKGVAMRSVREGGSSSKNFKAFVEWVWSQAIGS